MSTASATVTHWQGETVEVRRETVGGVDAPAQFLWRGRLWQVCAVEAHWEESAAWWLPSAASDSGNPDDNWGPQRAVYRVEAGCGRHGRRDTFDLAFDPDSGRWQLDRVTSR